METFKCVGDRCTRPACCHYNKDETRPLCYIHAACEKKGELSFFDFNSAKRQAAELKQIAAEVWEELVEELEETGAKMAKTGLLVKPVVTLQVAPSTSDKVKPLADRNASESERGTIWDIAKTSSTLNSTGKAADLLTEATDLVCPRCHVQGKVRYRCISSSIDAAKADTWGSSNRPDRVLQYTCGSCNKTWLVEEG